MDLHSETVRASFAGGLNLLAFLQPHRLLITNKKKKLLSMASVAFVIF